MQRDKLFASPRGNAVMKAKRVTGESANTILTRHVVLEKCGKCKERASVTWNYTGTHKVRSCMECLGGKKRKNTLDLLDLPWQSVWEQK